MEVESEEEKSISFCSFSVRKNLFSRSESHEDSGFASATPGSREQSYKSHYDDYFMTPNNETPDVADNNEYLYRKHAQSSFLKEVDHEKMMEICCTPIISIGDTLSKRSKIDIHEKTAYMECEESFYDNENHAARVLSYPSSGSNSLDKETNNGETLHEPISTIEMRTPPNVNNLISHQSNITPKASVVSPKRNSPLKSKHQRLKSLFKRKSLHGFEYVDILYFLGQKYSYPHIVKKILSNLSVSDLLNVRAVSKTWEQICNNDLNSRKAMQQYKKLCAKSKENMKVTDSGARRILGPRRCLSPIHNLQRYKSPPPPSSPAVSPRSKRFTLFCKEGEKLDSQSRLMRCPRCTLPAQCSKSTENNKLGQCLSKDCHFKFCTVCLNEFHYSTQCYRVLSCPSIIRKSNSRQSMVIGSKASKRRLSRT